MKSGMLPILKPSGLISKDVSRQLTRKFGKMKLGHVGTLDPMASGVLPIVVGNATRLQDHLLAMPKTYELTIDWGRSTDTLDVTGDVLEEKRDFELPTREDLRRCLEGFVGSIEQMPPLYSAVKFKGRELYKYARSGQVDGLDLSSLLRRVTIFSIDLLEHGGRSSRMVVRCSKGTYVRSLCRDIGDAFGIPTVVSAIDRREAAGVESKDCVPLEELLELDSVGSKLIPIADLKLDMPRWRCLSDVWTRKLRQGQKLLVRSDHFAKSLIGHPSKELDGFREQQMLLLDEHGFVLGLGSSERPEDGMFRISLKKGLA